MIIRQMFRSQISSPLLWGSGIAFAIQVFGTGIKYVLQILFARWMGASEYGIFSYAYNWSLLLSVAAGLGLTSSAIRFVPEYIAKQSWSLLNGFIARSNQIVFGSGLIIALIGAGIAWQTTTGNTRLTLLLGLLIVPLTGLATHQSQLLRGMKNIFWAFTPTRVIQPALAMLLAFVLMRVLGGISSTTALIVTALSILLVTLIQSLSIVRIVPKNAQNFQSQFETRTWLKISMPMLISAVAFTFINQIDIIMVGFFREPAQVGIYAAAAKTATLVSFVLVSVNAIVAPLISELFTLKEYRKLMVLARTATYWMFVPVFAVTTFLALFGKHILNLFGPEFVQGYWPLMILAGGQLVNALTGPVGYITELTGHQNYSARVYLAAALLAVILNFALVPRLGILGASIGTAAALSASNLWLYFFVYSKILKKTDR